jgi:hypothetical protein
MGQELSKKPGRSAEDVGLKICVFLAIVGGA